MNIKAKFNGGAGSESVEKAEDDDDDFLDKNSNHLINNAKFYQIMLHKPLKEHKSHKVISTQML